MPSINMIAARRADKRRLERNRQKLFYLILGELGLVLVVVSGMAVRLVNTQLMSSALSAKLAQLKDKVAEIQHLQDATAALQPKVTALNQAASNTLFWYSAMQDVTSSLPTSSWLTSIGTNGDPGLHATANGVGGPTPDQFAKLNVEGQAANQFDVGSAMLRLNMFPSVSQVKLHQVQVAPGDNNGGGTSGVTFSIEVQLKPQAPLQTAAGDSNAQKS